MGIVNGTLCLGIEYGAGILSRWTGGPRAARRGARARGRHRVLNRGSLELVDWGRLPFRAAQRPHLCPRSEFLD